VQDLWVTLEEEYLKLQVLALEQEEEDRQERSYRHLVQNCTIQNQDHRQGEEEEQYHPE